MGVDAEWMIQSIHTNFIRLKNRVTMVQVKDFPEAMQCQVVGVIRNIAPSASRSYSSGLNGSYPEQISEQ